MGQGVFGISGQVCEVTVAVKAGLLIRKQDCMSGLSGYSSLHDERETL
jgi:hypothetical protein